MTESQPHFDDRLLNCADCHGEFIFTAGEQLFFHDKQFKNDPKRCKPCKSRRSGLAAVANGTGPAPAGLSRTETRTECSECGVQTTVPFKPTQGRPVLCRQCFQVKSKAVKPLDPMPLATPYAIEAAAAQAQTASALTGASANASGAVLSAEAATVAAASMAAASSLSSVASAADLASIANMPTETLSTPLIPTTLLAAATEAEAFKSTELVAAIADGPDA